MLIICLVVLAVAIAINVAVSNVFKNIAEDKGYYDNFFWWVFFLGTIGMLMVVALPDKNARNVTISNLSDNTQNSAKKETQKVFNDELPTL